MRGFWAVAAVGVLVALSLWGLDLEASRIGNAPQALADLARDAWPPATEPAFLRELASALVATFQMAIVATAVGAVGSIVLASFSARNLAPSGIAFAARSISAAIRVLPAILWAILTVLIFGLGPLAGIVALALYTVGYLSKLQYEAIEGVPRDALDAVRAMGAGRFQQAWHVALPEAGNALRSQLLFMLEYNVRASSIVGLVGAGGIGQLMFQHLRFFQYDRLLTVLVVLFVAVAILDGLSQLLRRRFVESDEAPARWRDLVARRGPST